MRKEIWLKFRIIDKSMTIKKAMLCLRVKGHCLTYDVTVNTFHMFYRTNLDGKSRYFIDLS